MPSEVADAAAVPAVRVTGLGKSYGPVRALSDVSFSAPARGVTALLGLNGAGKTTLFQILTGLFVADAGDLEIFGVDVVQSPVAALATMGVVFQQPVLDLDLTVMQNLTFFAGLHGLRGASARTAIGAAVRRFRIAETARHRVRDLSGGTRRKVELARALITAPRLLLLDEPSQGLDTQSRIDLVRDIFALCKDHGTSVLWATHLVGEVERADKVVILSRGVVAAQGSPAALAASVGAPDLEAAFLAIANRDVDARAA